MNRSEEELYSEFANLRINNNNNNNNNNVNTNFLRQEDQRNKTYHNHQDIPTSFYNNIQPEPTSFYNNRQFVGFQHGFYNPPQSYSGTFNQIQHEPVPSNEYGVNDNITNKNSVETTNIKELNWKSQFLLPEQLIDKKNIELKLMNKKKPNKDSRCYVCKPRGKVKKHVICSSESGLFVFHHDLHKRPVIIMSTTRHINNANDMTPEESIDLFKSIKSFANFWSIEDYQISVNCGKWQSSDHFHTKIRISEKNVNKLRRDHFEKIKMESRYKENKYDSE